MIRTAGKYLFVALFLNVSFIVFSQPSVQFKWSNYKKVHKYSHNIFLSQFQSNFISVLKNGKYFEVIKYDSTLKIICETKFKIDKNYEKIIGIWQHQCVIYIATTHDLKNQQLALRIRIINTDSLQNKISSYNLIVLNENRFSRNLFFKISENDSSIDIYHPNTHKDENENQTLTFYSYSRNLKLDNKALVEIPYKYSLCQVLKVEKTDSTNFIVYTKQFYIRAIEKRGMSPNYFFGFYKINPTTDSIAKVYLKNNNIYLDAGRLRHNANSTEASGFFSNIYQGGKQGIWYLKYDYKENIVIDTILKFNQKIKDLSSNNFQKSVFKKTIFESFYTDYLIKEKNSKRVIVAEQFLLIPASFGSSYTYNRFYGDILILYLDKNLNIYNGRRINKAQNTFNNIGEFSSYYLERNDSTLYFFYNDNLSSITKSKAQQLIWHKSSCLVLFKSNEFSEEKKILADYEGIGGIIQVRDMFEIGKNKFLVYARKKKKAKLGIMTFTEN